jgi:hypothetical protein
MEQNAAVENLQVIRTLMERAAIYRRTLAPIMLFAGALGLVTGAVGTALHLNTIRAYGCLWLGTAVVAVVGAFLIARGQALKAHEPFWSPPTRRVAQALLPLLMGGLFLSAVFTLSPSAIELGFLVPVIWLIFYGCALHAAGFFMPRGIKLFGWVFLAGGCVLLACAVFAHSDLGIHSHLLMGFFFGVLHVAYGVYLYLTEKRKTAA